MDFVQVLKSAVEQGCSDVHIVVGKPPMMRKNGEVKPIDAALPVLSGEDTKGLIYSILYEDQQARFEESLELVPGQIVDQCLISLLHRDRMDPTRLIETRRQAVL